MLWRDAVSLERYPAVAQPAGELDDYLRAILSRADFRDLATQLLHAAIQSEKRLVESRSLYARATACLKPDARQQARKGFDQAYRGARSGTRLTAGIARVGVAKRMATSESGSYCFQAMESAVDALRDSAREADKCAACRQQARGARALRASMLEVWQRSQRAKDPGLIADYDLLGAFEQSFPRASGAAPTGQP